MKHLTDDELIRWLSKASIFQLMIVHRFAGPKEPFKRGEVGKYLIKMLDQRRKEITEEKFIRLGVLIGWEDDKWIKMKN